MATNPNQEQQTTTGGDGRTVSPSDNQRSQGIGTTFAQGQLRSIVERIERLEEEKKAIADDIKEVYAEAKANGFDSKILRKAIAIRKRDTAEREDEEAILALYMQALGMLSEFEKADEEDVL